MIVFRSQFVLFACAALLAACVCRVSLGDDSPNSVVREAEQAMREGNYPRAIQLYQKARELRPHSAEIPYNLGVAHYRNGEFEQAAEAFKQATSLANDGGLRSRAIYNMGNSAYAQTLKAMKEQSNPDQAKKQLDQSTDLLKQAISDYKRAIDVNPNDEDAKANAELSHQLLKKLQEMQQQAQQNQSQQQQQQNQEQQQQQQQQQQQEQQQRQQQQQNQSQTAQSQEQNSEQTQQDQQQQSQDQQAQQDSQKPQDEKEQEKEQPSQAKLAAKDEKPDEKEPKDQGQHVQHEQKDKRTMTRDEADRLLQSVRDKERKRRAELARRETAKHAPADKDW